MTEQKLPEGWTPERMAAVAAYYDAQSEDEELAELEAAWADEDTTLLEVPRELVPTIEALIAAFEALRAEHAEPAPVR